MKTPMGKILVCLLYAGMIFAFPSTFGGKGLYRIRSADNEWKFKNRPTLSINLHLEGLEKTGDSLPDKGFLRAGITYVFNPLIEGYLILRAEGVSDLKKKVAESKIITGRGDTDIGIKVLAWDRNVFQLSPGLDITVPTGDSGFSSKKFIISPYGALSANIGELFKEHILSFHSNVQFRIGDEISPFNLGLGTEIHSSFITYILEIVKGHQIDNGWRLTPGLRFHPKPWFNLDLFVDFGLSEGTPDYGANLGFSLTSPVIREREILPVGDIAGYVEDSISGKPILANIEIIELGEQEKTAPETGIFKFTGIPEGIYSVLVSSNNYQSKTRVVTLKRDEMKNLRFSLLPLKANIKGIIQDRNGNPVENASIMIDGYENKSVRSDKEGEFSISLIPGNYEFKIEKENFQKKEISLTMEKDSTLEFFLERVKGSLIFEGTVYFDYDKANIKESQRSILDSVATILKMYSDARCELRGHTDERGSLEYNERLSYARAYAVQDYLMTQHFIQKKRISIFGFSRTQAKFKEPEKNRRVEIFVIK